MTVFHLTASDAWLHVLYYIVSVYTAIFDSLPQATKQGGYESWLNHSIKSSEVFPDGFNSYRRDRPGGRGGGVFLLVSQLYESHQPEELMVDASSDLRQCG